jgi:hypothetical protein
MNTSATSKTEDVLMSVVAKMMKVDQLSPGKSMVEPTRDGRLSTLIKLRKFNLKVLTKTLDSNATEPSTLDQDFHCKELLNAMVPITSGSEDSDKTILDNNFSLIALPRPSDLRSGPTMLWKSKAMERTITLDSPVASPQDGGNCSDSKVTTLLMREERLWMYQELKMMSKETSSCGESIKDLTSNGTSSMLMNIQKTQSKVNSARNSVCTLRDHSTLSLNSTHTDTST